jgi:hypothetical protein
MFVAKKNLEDLNKSSGLRAKLWASRRKLEIASNALEIKSILSRRGFYPAAEYTFICHGQCYRVDTGGG